MPSTIRELRDTTGLSQRKFGELLGIPVSTIRKWEHGESNPPSYVLRLIAESLPAADASLQKIVTERGESFFYDKDRHAVIDRLGNRISTKAAVESVNQHNLGIYLEDLFQDFYRIQAKFDRDCKYDLTDGIIWKRGD